MVPSAQVRVSRIENKKRSHEPLWRFAFVVFLSIFGVFLINCRQYCEFSKKHTTTPARISDLNMALAAAFFFFVNSLFPVFWSEKSEGLKWCRLWETSAMALWGAGSPETSRIPTQESSGNTRSKSAWSGSLTALTTWFWSYLFTFFKL